MEVLQAKNLKKIYGSGNNAVHCSFAKKQKTD